MMFPLLTIAVATATTAGPADDEILGLDAALEAVEATPAVVVTASRRAQAQADAPTAVEVVDAAEVRAAGAEDLGEVLAAHPGVALTRTFRGVGIQLQGLDASQVLILVDGQRLPGRVDGTLDLSRLPAERIERVEVVKGAGSALYGSDALGGVVNIITRRPEPGVQSRLHLAVGSLPTVDGSASVGLRGEQASLQLEAGYHRAAAVDLTPEDPGTSASAFDTLTGRVKGTYDPTPRLTLSAEVDLWRRRSRGVDLGPPLPGGLQAVYDRRNTTFTWAGRGGLDARLGAHRVQVHAQGSGFADDFSLDQRGRDGEGSLDQAQRTTERLGELNAEWSGQLHDEHLSSAGVMALLETISSPRIQPDRARRGRFAVFAQHEWTPVGGALALVPGLRLDLDTTFGASLSPKLATRFEPAEQVTLRASYGAGFRAPSFREQLLLFENPSAGYVVEGNLDLRPERGHNVSVEGEWRPAEGLSVRAQLFQNWLRDLIQTGSGEAGAPGQPLRFRYVNIGRAITRGLEAQVAWTPWAGTGLELGHALLDARDLDLDRRLEGRAVHRFTARVFFRAAAWELQGQLRGTVVGPRPFYTDDGDGGYTTEEAPTYATLDARVEKGLWGTLHVFLGADNLLGAGDPRLLPLQPRSVYGGLDATF
jgi:outer membrane receptor for ferrienterochelin and colicins